MVEVNGCRDEGAGYHDQGVGCECGCQSELKSVNVGTMIKVWVDNVGAKVSSRVLMWVP